MITQDDFYASENINKICEFNDELLIQHATVDGSELEYPDYVILSQCYLF
ncbi:MAG: hypothetical protein MJK08_00025 [Campylobacterales bacterium]|nr:hypothetical protein [Campylobacterales bacterium]